MGRHKLKTSLEKQISTRVTEKTFRVLQDMAELKETTVSGLTRDIVEEKVKDIGEEEGCQ